MKFAAFACVLAAAGLIAAPASAKPLRNGGASIEQVASVLRAAGLPAEIGVDQGGDPNITSAAEGLDFEVLCYPRAAKPREREVICASIQFSNVIDLDEGTTYARMNEWNQQQRYAQAWLDGDMDPFIDMSVELERGASTELIAENLVDWLELIGKWKAYNAVD